MIQNESQTRLKASQMMRRPITWTQISLEASEDLRGLIGREPKAAQLVLALIEQMEPGGGGIVVASRTTMAELIGASVPTVARALRVLMNEGWVQRIALAVRQLWQSIAVWPGLAPAATCRTLFSVQPSLRHVPSKTQSPWPPLRCGAFRRSAGAKSRCSMALARSLQASLSWLASLPLLPRHPRRPSWRPVASFASTSAQGRSSPACSARRCSHGR